MPLPEGDDLFLGGRFFRISFFVEESRSGRGEREQSFGPLSLSLLHDDTAIRCEEQLIKH